MADLSEQTLSDNFNLIDEEQLNTMAKLLEMIDCPSDLRGLRKAIATVEYLFSLYPSRVTTLFGIDHNSFRASLLIIHSYQHKNSSAFWKESHGRGWKSERPIYSLLFIFSDNRTSHAAAALLLFLEHYLNNETKIVGQNRAEESVRAFRMLYTDESTRDECFRESSLDRTVNNIFAMKERLKSDDDDNYLPRAQLGYLYQLEHFYRLDWVTRGRHERRTAKQIRGHYSRKRYERITGSDNLMTPSLNTQKLPRIYEEAGVTKSEDLPDVTIIKSSSPPPLLQPYEQASTSIVKDSAIHWFNTKKVNIDIRRCHNLLPTCRTILQPHELKLLMRSLTNTSTGAIGGIDKKLIRAVLLIMLITARDLQSVLSIKQASTQKEVGFHFDGNDILLNVAPEPTTLSPVNNELLLPVSSVISITLPEHLVTHVSPYFSDTFIEPIQQKKPVEWQDAIQRYLKELNRKFSIQISLTRIEHHLINWVSAHESYDPVLLDILAEKTRYQSRSAKHYAYYTETEINDELHALWNALFTEAAHQQAENSDSLTPTISSELKMERGVGSAFTPKADALSTWISEKASILLSNKPFAVSSTLEGLVNYHNAYTLYTIIMLKSGTGYRAVYNPLPSLDLALLRYQSICISDKDSKTLFNHTRVVACPDILKSQILHYQAHIEAFANLIAVNFSYFAQQYFTHSSHVQHLELTSKTERLEQFLTIKNSSGTDGMFLFFTECDEHASHTKKIVQNSSPTFLNTYFPFPLNFGRHYMRRYLQMNNVHQELIKFQLGHWMTGETALEKFSELNHVEAIQALLPTLNSMMDELGWRDIPSLLTRKRA
jgi:hypothetical protein